MFFLFLICCIMCNIICFGVYKYQKTIAPVNQNIIDKLSFFSIFCLNLINTSQAVCVMWRAAVEPLNVQIAIIFRLLLFSFLFLGCLVVNSLSIYRLLYVSQWSFINEADPDKLFFHTLVFKTLCTLIFFCTNLPKDIHSGVSPNVENNMVSYLTQKKVEKEDRFLNHFLYVSSLITFANISITYIFIHLFLKFKHSKAITIAERSNFNTPESFFSFKSLWISFFLFIICGVFNLYVYFTSFYKNNNYVPPVTLLFNFASLFSAIYVVSKKQKFLEFVKRRWITMNIVLPDYYPCKKSRRNKIQPLMAWH